MLHPTRRQAEILKAVRVRGSCAIADLAEELRVSEETIRRDVRPLASEGMLLRIHGRVISPERFRETPFRNRMREAQAEKQRIAARAAALVNDGDSLIIDTGTTTSFVARALTEHSNLVVVTNSVDVAHTLATRNGNQVYMAGGRLRGDDGASLGAAAVRFVEQFSARHAILSMKGIDAELGLMDSYLSEAEFSRAVIRRSECVTVVADHSKFGVRGFVTVCGFESVHTLVTSAAPPEPFGAVLSAAGVEVALA